MPKKFVRLQDDRGLHFLNFLVAVPPTAVHCKMARILIKVVGVAVGLYTVNLAKVFFHRPGVSGDNSVFAEKCSK